MDPTTTINGKFIVTIMGIDKFKTFVLKLSHVNNMNVLIDSRHPVISFLLVWGNFWTIAEKLHFGLFLNCRYNFKLSC